MQPKETLQSVRDWAIASFPDDFAKLENLLRSFNCRFFPFYARDDTAEFSLGVQGLRVGTSNSDGTPIYAWNGPESICVGHEFETRKFELHTDIANPKIDFTEPFSFVAPAEDEVSLARFETLVRYIHLMRPSAYMIRRTSFFKEHFPNACRDVAEHLARRASETPTRSPRVPRTPRIFRSASAQITPQRPIMPTSPGLASGVLLRNLEQAFGSYRASVFGQVGTAQATSRRETAELSAKICDLELELVTAANRTKDIGTQSTALNTRIQELETVLLNVEKEKTDLGTRSAELSTKISGLEAKLATADKDNEGLEKETTELKAKICDLESGLQGVNKAKKKTEQAVAELKTKLRELGAKLKGAEKDKKSTEKEASEHKTRIRDLEARLQDAKKEVKSVEKRATDLAEKIAEAEAQKSEAERKAETWKSRYEELKKDVLGAVMKPE
ncbi:uncharacterized protein M421DRAFT_5645 [Didymella exigua CBS 183.55]|uniref:Uncharacterized protein n=1 Tax=Didymella exigua CBS 183.55 TaxID=1150837 RepID=A0A6A5RJI8_9PLEO|nr:uncharacterized protein M421DRAFT_5645 [Didymella exigua CBS 183.55]KAF1927982.1 hypothetical protein M421DRAFT_5645 [Didymella exigua CBS 183.55]